jgi:Arc/MetJ-type ribon-helix-helix transcriptional regulator
VPRTNQDSSRIISVRLPNDLIARLDRWLDWLETSRQIKSSRNAAMREALSDWLDDQEQRAGFLTPHTLHQQFEATYHSLSRRRDWVFIHRLRQQLNWPRERFDAVVEGLRADHHVELDRTEPDDLSPQAIQDSYQVHGHLYIRLRWCD